MTRLSLQSGKPFILLRQNILAKPAHKVSPSQRQAFGLISVVRSVVPHQSLVQTYSRPEIIAARVSKFYVPATLFAAAMFNFVLASINANIAPLGPFAVISCEAVIDAVAIYVSFQRQDPFKQKWVGLIVFLVSINSINSLGGGSFDLKFLRDVLIIPIFAMLGLTSTRADIVSTVVRLQVIVLAVLIFEAINPELFGKLLNITSYYINTRGFDEASFWSTENTDLFVSATRPGERFLFASLNIHRLSSIFLEPVSLGNYCVIVVMILISLWDYISPTRRWFLVLSEAMILIGCDGRFATVSIAVMITIRFAAPRLPRFSNIVYLPGVLLIGAIATMSLNLSPSGDDFPSRTAGSIAAINEMDLSAIFGFDAHHAYEVMDSGVAYLIYSQSLIGAAAIWLLISCGLRQDDQASSTFSHQVSIYVSLNLLISYSMFSIKTAALLWCAFGAMRSKKNIPFVLPSAGQQTLAAKDQQD